MGAHMMPAHSMPRGRRLARLGLAASVVLALAIGVGEHAGAQDSGDGNRIFTVSDTFDRSVESGWGTADSGQTWQVIDDQANSFAVPGHGGRLSVHPGRSVSATVPGRAEDVDVVSTAVLAALPSVTRIYHGLTARTQADGSAYRGKIVVSADGTFTLGFTRTAGWTESLVGETAVPGTVTAGQPLNLEISVIGSDPVLLAARAWSGTGPAPDWQYRTADSSSARLTQPGGVGIWTYLSSSERTPATVDVTRFEATGRAGAVSRLDDGAAAPAGVLVASDDFGRATDNSLGTADTGGEWTTNTDEVAQGGGSARFDALAPGYSVRGTLGQSRAADTDVFSSVALPTIGDAGYGIYHSVEARVQPDGSAYRGKATIRAGGTMTVSFTRVDGSTETGLAEVPIPTVLAPGRRFDLELQVTGTDPVRLAVRAWPAGDPVPQWEATVTDGSSRRITGAGSVGFWDYLSRSAQSGQIDYLAFDAYALSETATPVDPTSRPSSTDTSSIAPTPSTSRTETSSIPPTPSTASTETSPIAPTSSSVPVSTSSSPTSSSSSPRSTPATTPSSASTSSSTSSSPSPSSTSSSATTTSVTAPPVTTPNAADPGSLPVGSATYPVPAGALFVAPSGSDSAAGSINSPLRTIATAVSRAAAGQTIVLRGGVYHEGGIFISDAKIGLTIQAYPAEAVWMDGAVPVTNWVASGSVFKAGGWMAQFDHSASFETGSDAGGFVNSAYPMAAWPDQLFVDGVQQQQVAANGSIGAGQFAVDYASHTLIMGSSPGGHTVEATNLANTFVVSAADVTMRGFGIRRYATSLPTSGTVYMARPGDTLQNMVFTDIAAQSISMYAGAMTVDHVTVLRSGLLGISGTQADGSTVTNSVVRYSNTEHFNPAPSAAAIKITCSRHIKIADNVLTDNTWVAGVWLDQSVVDFTITGNQLSGNGGGNMAGNILAELSDTGIIANNTISGGDTGVEIYDSGNIKVFNNTISGSSRGSVFLTQDERRETTPGIPHDPRQPVPDPTCPWLIRNVTISNNVFGWNGGAYGFQVYALDKATHIPASAMNLVVTGNMFHSTDNRTDPMVGWGGSDNVTVTRYNTPDALNNGLGKSWSNGQAGAGLTAAQVLAAAPAGLGVPLPADVAAAVGQPTGVVHMGAF